MSVIKKLYKEIFLLVEFGTPPQSVFATILGSGNIIYGYEDADWDMTEVRDFVRKYGATSNEIHPTLAQLYFLYFKHNLNILASLPEGSLSYDVERALPSYSYWVNVPDVVSFYKRFSPKKFANNINFTKRKA